MMTSIQEKEIFNMYNVTYLKCEKCGRTFACEMKDYPADIYENRYDPARWEEWVKQNITLCDECYYDFCKQQEALNGYVIVRIPYHHFMQHYRKNRKIRESYDPFTKSIEIIVPPEEYYKLSAANKLYSARMLDASASSAN